MCLRIYDIKITIVAFERFAQKCFRELIVETTTCLVYDRQTHIVYLQYDVMYIRVNIFTLFSLNYC